MKGRRMLGILVVALGLMVCQAKLCEAAPMGTAFTYQGRLMDANSVADGEYDFEFKLFDDPCTGTQQGSTIDFNDLDVIHGHFAVELDFGSDVFDGDARWLETMVAHADGSDPCTLSPRVELTPTPYSLQTRGIFVDNAGYVGIGTTNPYYPLEVKRSADRIFAARIYNESATGHGLSVRVGSSGTEGAFQIYRDEGIVSTLVKVEANGNVGIGTPSPTAKLHIGGMAGVDGIKFPDGTLQTTASTGGDITAVNAGTGLTGGGTTGDVTLDVQVPLDLSGTGPVIKGTDSNSGNYGYLGGINDGVRGIGSTYGVFGSGTYGVFGTGTAYGVYGVGSASGLYGKCYDGSGTNYGLLAVAGSTGSNSATGVHSLVQRNGTGNYWSGFFLNPAPVGHTTDCMQTCEVVVR